MTENPDPLAPSRGCALGLLIGGLLWVAFFVALAVIVTAVQP